MHRRTKQKNDAKSLALTYGFYRKQRPLAFETKAHAQKKKAQKRSKKTRENGEAHLVDGGRAGLVSFGDYPRQAVYDENTKAQQKEKGVAFVFPVLGFLLADPLRHDTGA